MSTAVPQTGLHAMPGSTTRAPEVGRYMRLHSTTSKARPMRSTPWRLRSPSFIPDTPPACDLRRDASPHEVIRVEAMRQVVSVGKHLMAIIALLAAMIGCASGGGQIT